MRACIVAANLTHLWRQVEALTARCVNPLAEHVATYAGIKVTAADLQIERYLSFTAPIPHDPQDVVDKRKRKLGDVDLYLSKGETCAMP